MLNITVTDKNGKVLDQFEVFGTWLESDPWEVKKANIWAVPRAQHLGNSWVDHQFAMRIRKLLEDQNVTREVARGKR